MHIVSWNVAGLSDPNQKILARRYLSSLKHPIHILMIQELKVGKFRLDLALESILPSYHKIVAYPTERKGGSTLLIHPDFAITTCGTIPGGLVAWVKI